MYSGIAPLYIDGSATVKATGGLADVSGGESYGVNGVFVKIDGGSLEAEGGKAEAYSCGMYVAFGFYFSGGTLKTNGGAAAKSHGIFNDDLIEISGGTVSASGICQ